MKRTSYMIISLTLMWFMIILVLAFFFLEQDKSGLTFVWWIYMVGMLGALVLIDYFLNFSSRIIHFVYVGFLMYVILFSLANLLNWYDDISWLNRFEHMLGAFLLSGAITGLFAVYNKFQELSVRAQVIVIVGTANFFAVLNEIIELGMDYWLDQNTVGPDIYDTSFDLLMNFIGFLVFGFIFWLYHNHFLPHRTSQSSA